MPLIDDERTLPFQQPGLDGALNPDFPVGAQQRARNSLRRPLPVLMRGSLRRAELPLEKQRNTF